MLAKFAIRFVVILAVLIAVDAVFLSLLPAEAFMDFSILSVPLVLGIAALSSVFFAKDEEFADSHH